MKHLLLKFNHGVEIGAHLAYRGHFSRTRDLEVDAIALDELIHRYALKSILAYYGEVPFWGFDLTFKLIGTSIGYLCRVAPIWSLNRVAGLMESFAVFNYRRLALAYPLYGVEFIAMAEAEERHRAYFLKSGSR